MSASVVAVPSALRGIGPSTVRRPCAPAPPAARRPRAVAARGLGDDLASGFLDVASLVSGSSFGKKTPFDALATRIGDVCYADMQGWHIYFRDMKVSDAPRCRRPRRAPTRAAPPRPGTYLASVREPPTHRPLRFRLSLAQAEPGADVTMSQLLANQIGPMMTRDGVDERDVEGVFKKVPVSLGKRKTLSLLDVTPSMCIRDLMRELEDAARDL